MEQVYWDILQQSIVIAIGVILPPVLVVLAREANKVANALVVRIEAEVGAENFAVARELVAEAVQAAEQMGLTEMIVNEGEAKKAFAMAYVQQALSARNINLDINEIDAAVEAACKVAFGE